MLCSSFLKWDWRRTKIRLDAIASSRKKQMGECSAAQPQAIFVTERAAENHQQINEPSDAE